MINQPRKKKIKKRKNFNLQAVINLAVKANQKAQSLQVLHKQKIRINRNNIKGKKLRKIMKNQLNKRKMLLHKIVIQIMDQTMENLLPKKL
jgi:hypothetical protein